MILEVEATQSVPLNQMLINKPQVKLFSNPQITMQTTLLSMLNTTSQADEGINSRLIVLCAAYLC